MAPFRGPRSSQTREMWGGPGSKLSWSLPGHHAASVAAIKGQGQSSSTHDTWDQLNRALRHQHGIGMASGSTTDHRHPLMIFNGDSGHRHQHSLCLCQVYRPIRGPQWLHRPTQTSGLLRASSWSAYSHAPPHLGRKAQGHHRVSSRCSRWHRPLPAT